MLLRLLILVFIIWLLFRARAYLKRLKNKNKSADRVDKMVPCATCGVYVPLQQAIVGDDTYYCCEAHRKETRTRN